MPCALINFCKPAICSFKSRIQQDLGLKFSSLFMGKQVGKHGAHFLFLRSTFTPRRLSLKLGRNWEIFPVSGVVRVAIQGYISVSQAAFLNIRMQFLDIRLQFLDIRLHFCVPGCISGHQAASLCPRLHFCVSGCISVCISVSNSAWNTHSRAAKLFSQILSEKQKPFATWSSK